MGTTQNPSYAKQGFHFLTCTCGNPNKKKKTQPMIIVFSSVSY